MTLSRTIESFVTLATERHKGKYSYGEYQGVGKKRKVEIICPAHGLFLQAVPSHLLGKGCPSCAHKLSVVQTSRTHEEFVAKASQIHGGIYTYRELSLEGTGKGNRAKVGVICPVHDYFEQSRESHLQGHGCIKCSHESIGSKLSDSLEDYLVKVRSVHGDRYEYGLFVGTDEKRKIQVVCPKHGLFLQIKGLHLEGKGCPKCSMLISKPNLEIQAFLQSLGVVADLEGDLPGTSKKLDVVVSEKNVAVEFNGNRWHSTRYKKDQNCHKYKLVAARKAQLRLIQIFSDEWRDRQLACKLILSRAVGAPELNVNARSCVVSEVPYKVAADFLNLWHIQGSPQASNRFLGLLHNDNLVAVMGFCRNTSKRGEKSLASKVELTRFATSCNVRGGFSRLLSNWLRRHPEVLEVVSYSDDRLFLGRMYGACGFENSGSSPVDYCYLDRRSEHRLHKAGFQKSRLKKMLGDKFDASKTERELTEAAGFYRIYDCGKTRWVYKVKNPTEVG